MLTLNEHNQLTVKEPVGVCITSRTLPDVWVKMLDAKCNREHLMLVGASYVKGEDEHLYVLCHCRQDVNTHEVYYELAKGNGVIAMPAAVLKQIVENAL